MAKFNQGFGVSFNDNDGGSVWFASSVGLDEYRRYARNMGWFRARLHFIRKLWIALKHTEKLSNAKEEKAWKRLNGWHP